MEGGRPRDLDINVGNRFATVIVIKVTDPLRFSFSCTRSLASVTSSRKRCSLSRRKDPRSLSSIEQQEVFRCDAVLRCFRVFLGRRGSLGNRFRSEFSTRTAEARAVRRLTFQRGSCPFNELDASCSHLSLPKAACTTGFFVAAGRRTLLTGGEQTRFHGDIAQAAVAFCWRCATG